MHDVKSKRLYKDFWQSVSSFPVQKYLIKEQANYIHVNKHLVFDTQYSTEVWQQKEN